MEEQEASCSRVSGAVPEAPVESQQAPPESAAHKEVPRMVARVGQKAPDFAAPAYYRGGFTNVEAVRLCRQVGDAVLLPR